MKVRNMVRGGVVLTVSLGLASLGTGMGLTSSSSPASSSVPGTGISLGSSVQPQLICDPGVTCGDEEAFYHLGYSGPAVGGLQVCSESNYDMGRFGPISALCAGKGNVIILVAGAAMCAVSALGAIYAESGNEVEGATVNGRAVTAACVTSGIAVYVGVAVAMTSPAPLPH